MAGIAIPVDLSRNWGLADIQQVTGPELVAESNHAVIVRCFRVKTSVKAYCIEGVQGAHA